MDPSSFLDRGRPQVDRPVQELLNHRADQVVLVEGGNLVVEFELLEDFLHVLGKAIKVGLEVRLELGGLPPVLEVP